MSGFRRCGRKPLRCAVKFSHEMAGDFQAETYDISDSGMFVRCAELVKVLAVGDTLNAKLDSEMASAEDKLLKIVRLTDEGVGLAFE